MLSLFINGRSTRTPPKPQPLGWTMLSLFINGRSTRTPPKPQPRGGRTFAAVLTRSLPLPRCGPCVTCARLATAPLSPTRPQTAASALPSLGRRRPRNRTASRPPPTSLARAARDLSVARRRTPPHVCSFISVRSPSVVAAGSSVVGHRRWVIAAGPSPPGRRLSQPGRENRRPTQSCRRRRGVPLRPARSCWSTEKRLTHSW